MLFSKLSSVGVWYALSASLALAKPTSTLSKDVVLAEISRNSPRVVFCPNAPQAIAGNYINPRNLAVSGNLKIRHGTTSLVSCDTASTTYIIVQIYESITQRIMSAMLEAAVDSILDHITIWGNAPIANGVFHQMGPSGISLEISSMRGHQTTYKVLAGALMALLGAMRSDGWGAASFDIYDGPDRKVGTGAVG